MVILWSCALLCSDSCRKQFANRLLEKREVRCEALPAKLFSDSSRVHSHPKAKVAHKASCFLPVQRRSYVLDNLDARNTKAQNTFVMYNCSTCSSRSKCKMGLLTFFSRFGLRGGRVCPTQAHKHVSSMQTATAQRCAAANGSRRRALFEIERHLLCVKTCFDWACV